MRSARSIWIALALVPALAMAARAPKPHTTYPSPSPAPQAGPRICGEDCLGGYVDKVLQAMMDHDPSHAPLAPDVRYTENGDAKPPGQGFWASASAVAIEGDGLSSLGLVSSAYRLYFADPTTGQAAYFGAVTENGVPGMMMLRLKAAGGQVSEIEAVIVRRETPAGSSDRSKAPVALDPKGFNEPEPTLLAGGERWAPTIMAAAANRYFDGMVKGSSAGVPLGADCVRRDNGVRTAGPPVAPPDDPNGSPVEPSVPGCAAQLDSGSFRFLSQVRRRILVVNEDRGLVMAVALADHGPQPEPQKKKTKGNQSAVPSPPPLSTDLMGVVFKMSEGKITRIEAIEQPVAPGIDGAWGR